MESSKTRISRNLTDKKEMDMEKAYVKKLDPATVSQEESSYKDKGEEVGPRTHGEEE